MDVGIQVIFSSFGSDASDSQVYTEEIRLCLLAEDLGYDVLWPVEHHFSDYSFCPDNMQFLSYLAGRTSTIHLGTAAVILPWNEPLRVAEKISMLDELADGRVRFGHECEQNIACRARVEARFDSRLNNGLEATPRGCVAPRFEVVRHRENDVARIHRRRHEIADADA